MKILFLGLLVVASVSAQIVPANSFSISPVSPPVSSGSGANTQVAYFTGATSLGSNAGFTTDGSGNVTALTLNKLTLTAPATGATLTIANGKTVTVSNTLTFAGTDFATITFQGTDTYVGRATSDTLTNKTYDTAGTGNVFKVNGTQLSAVTGTGSVVLATSPTLTTPTIGAATGTSLSVTGGGSSIALSNGGGSGNQQVSLLNQANQTYFGEEGASGGTIVTGSSAYSTVVGTSSTRSFHVFTNGAIGLTMSSSQGLTASSLAGTGSRAVLADANGLLSAPVSDETMKENLRELPERMGLATVMALRPLVFNYRDKSRFGAQDYLGFGARATAKLLPEVTGRDRDGIYYLSDEKLTAVLVKGMQQQQAIIGQIQAKIPDGGNADWWARSLAAVALLLAIRANLRRKE